MKIFEGVGDSEQTQNELTLLLKDSVSNSASNGVPVSKNLDIGKFEVLSATLLLKGIYPRTKKNHSNIFIVTTLL
jgi:hypothetical protein